MSAPSLRVWRTTKTILRITEISRHFGACPAMLRNEDVAAMRISYEMPVGFDESHLVAKEPFTQFDSWFREASKTSDIGEANAMVLATCGRLVPELFLLFCLAIIVLHHWFDSCCIIYVVVQCAFAILDFKLIATREGMCSLFLYNCFLFCRDCRPTARVVLLKGYDNTGFTFFTNYYSTKGGQLVSVLCNCYAIGELCNIFNFIINVTFSLLET